MRNLSIVAGFCLALAGCAATGPGDCGASSLSRFVGQPVVEVASIETPGPVRVVEQGARRDVSNRNRLTIVSSPRGRIVQLYCG